MLCGMRLSRESFKFTGLTLRSPQLVTAPADPDVNHFIHVEAFSPLSTTIQCGTCALTIPDTAGWFHGNQISPCDVPCLKTFYSITKDTFTISGCCHGDKNMVLVEL